jgi:hypothetical protein
MVFVVFPVVRRRGSAGNAERLIGIFLVITALIYFRWTLFLDT